MATGVCGGTLVRVDGASCDVAVTCVRVARVDGFQRPYSFAVASAAGCETESSAVGRVVTRAAHPRNVVGVVVRACVDRTAWGREFVIVQLFHDVQEPSSRTFHSKDVSALERLVHQKLVLNVRVNASSGFVLESVCLACRSPSVTDHAWCTPWSRDGYCLVLRQVARLSDTFPAPGAPVAATVAGHEVVLGALVARSALEPTVYVAHCLDWSTDVTNARSWFDWNDGASTTL